jgi:hypothetical protein
MNKLKSTVTFKLRVLDKRAVVDMELEIPRYFKLSEFVQHIKATLKEKFSFVGFSLFDEDKN